MMFQVAANVIWGQYSMGMKDIDDAKTNLAKYSEIMLCSFLWGNDDDDNHDFNEWYRYVYIMMKCVCVSGKMITFLKDLSVCL